jgi:hypothetical protein
MGWIVLLAVVVALAAIWVRRRKQREKQERLTVPDPERATLPGGVRWAKREELRPETAEAYERGVMSNDQMAEMLRACGWNAKLDKNGNIVVPNAPKDEEA